MVRFIWCATVGFVCPLLFVFSLGTSCNRSLLLLRAHAGGKRLFCCWIYQRKKIRFVSSGDKLLTRKWVVFPSAFEQQFFCAGLPPLVKALLIGSRFSALGIGNSFLHRPTTLESARSLLSWREIALARAAWRHLPTRSGHNKVGHYDVAKR